MLLLSPLILCDDLKVLRRFIESFTLDGTDIIKLRITRLSHSIEVCFSILQLLIDVPVDLFSFLEVALTEISVVTDLHQFTGGSVEV